jgi:hypothetical protein
MEVRPATPGQFEEIYPLLLDFANPRLSRDDWRRMLFDLPWPVDEEARGFVLRDGGAVVGFLGTIFSRRELNGATHRFCNLSSWIVKETHRAASLQLVFPVLALKSHTIVNLSPSAAAYEIFARLGFQPLESAQVLLPSFARPGELLRARGDSVITRPEVLLAELDAPGRTIAEHMAGTLAGQALLKCGARRCHVVATRSPWKGRWQLAQVQYASDWELFWEHLASVSGAFGRTLGTVGLRVESRHLRGRRPRLSVERPLPRPNLYRPASPDITPQMIDGLYSEAVGLRW